MDYDDAPITICTGCPYVPVPPPGAFDGDSWNPRTEQWCEYDRQGQRWRYHIEWGHIDPDLLAGSENDDTYFDVVRAYRRLPDENRATRKAQEAARRAAREANIPLPEDDDPAARSIILAHVRLVGYIVWKWIEENLDRKAIALEKAGQLALVELRAGKKIPKKRLEKIDRKLRILQRKAEEQERREAEAFQEITSRIREQMEADGIERIEVWITGNPSYRKSAERHWYRWQKAIKELGRIRRKKDVLERKRRFALTRPHTPNVRQKRCGATIAEELFAIGLLKLVKLVPLLPRLGRRYGWDPYDAPEHIVRYLTRVVTNAISDYRKTVNQREKSSKEHAVRLRRWGDLNHNRTTIIAANRDDEDDDADPRAEWLSDGRYHYVVQSSGSGVVDMEEHEHLAHAINSVCDDVKDRLLLNMKWEGILTEEEMAVLLDLGVKQISARWWRMRRDLERLFGLRRRQCYDKKESSKRVTRDLEKRKLAEELVAAWRSPIRPVTYVPAPHFPLSPMSAPATASASIGG